MEMPTFSHPKKKKQFLCVENCYFVYFPLCSRNIKAHEIWKSGKPSKKACLLLSLFFLLAWLVQLLFKRGQSARTADSRSIMEASRRMDRIGSHMSAAAAATAPASAVAGARDSPDDVVIVDAIRTPITRAKKVCVCLRKKTPRCCSAVVCCLVHAT